MEKTKQNTIRLRALEPGDLDMIYRWENDPALWPVGNTIAPLSRFQLNNYIRSYSGDIFQEKQLRLMITLGDECTPVGTIELFEFDPVNSRIGVGIFVDTPYRRKGIATQTISMIKNYCREQLSINSMWCVIAESNRPSFDLFINQGFYVAGTLKSWLRIDGKYHDALILQNIDL